MSIDKVRAYFKQYDMDERILEFPVSSATVDLAAEALHTEGKRIAKTLSFKKGEGCMLILFAGDAKVDNHKFKERFSTKAKMLNPDEVDSMVGHSIGGVCPFAVSDTVEVYLDESLRRFYTVFPAAGSSNSAIELSMDELYRYANARDWVDVGKDWEPAYCQRFSQEELPTPDLKDEEIILKRVDFRPADEKKGWVPAYHFEICRIKTGETVGKCDLRIGYCLGTYYGGNIGYEVFAPFRGNHYARRAAKLLMELAKRQGMPSVTISCNPENAASKKTLESLQGQLLETVEVPAYTESYRSGLRIVCIFRFSFR